MFDAGCAAPGLPRAEASAHVRLPAWVSSQLMQDLRHKPSSLSLCKSAFTAFSSLFLAFSSLFLAFSSCVLSFAEMHDAALRGLMCLLEALLRWKSRLSSVSVSP